MYVQTGGGTARGRHAVRVLQNTRDFTLESLRAAAYDSYLTWFAEQLPALIQAYDSLPAGDSLKTKVAAPIEQLRNWDLRWGATSIPTSVAVFWGERLGDRTGRDAVQALAEGTAALRPQDVSLGKRYRLPIKSEKDELRRRLRARRKQVATQLVDQRVTGGRG